MANIFLISSLRALAFIVLMPVVAFALFMFVVNQHMSIMGYVYSVLGTWESAALHGNGEGLVWMLVIMIFSILMNFLFVMVLPAIVGGLDSKVKKTQFYIGLITNSVFVILIPAVLSLLYQFNHLLTIVLTGLCAMSFILAFIVSAKFVAPGYRRAFSFKLTPNPIRRNVHA